VTRDLSGISYNYIPKHNMSSNDVHCVTIALRCVSSRCSICNPTRNRNLVEGEETGGGTRNRDAEVPQRFSSRLSVSSPARNASR
jgi:hypothetical protein